MTMRAYEVKALLAAGHRKFTLHLSDEIAEVLAFGPSWVRYKTPSMKLFLSTNMRSFGYSVKEVYTEKSPEASGQ